MRYFLLVSVLTLTACDPSAPQPKAPADPLFGAQREALKKAQGVQDQVDDAAAAQKKQIDQATQQ
jgi:hypothetical protein